MITIAARLPLHQPRRLGLDISVVSRLNHGAADRHPIASARAMNPKGGDTRTTERERWRQNHAIR